MSDAHRAAIAAANRRRLWTPEARDRIATRTRGTTHSDGTRAAIGAAVSAAWTPERRAALAEANRQRRGETRTTEQRAATSLRLKGHSVSDIQRAKVRAASMGNQNLKNAPIKGECVYCFGPATTRDHVIPRGRPGWDHPDNIVLACHPCNVSKGQRTPDEWFTAMTDGRRSHSKRRP